jgi:two-component system chemotaxis response regulator CheY
MRALVVDDSADIREILHVTLDRLGFDVIEAGDGQEALNTLNKHGAVDVVLVDVYMPRMNGIEFVRAARSDPRWKDLRLMMVSTENELSRVAEALKAGANEYVMKPFTQEIIYDKLRLMGLDLDGAPPPESKA